jgi:hypothetical protein
MLSTTRRVAKVQLSAETVRVLLARLSTQQWIPAVLQSEREFAQLAGIKGRDTALRRRPTFASGVEGDVFFRDDGVYYLVSHGASDSRSSPAVVFGLASTAAHPGLEIGLIADGATGLDHKIRVFSEAVEQALATVTKESQSSRLSWASPSAHNGPLARLRSAEDGAATYVAAQLDEASCRGAQTLVQPVSREILRELSRAGFTRENDLRGRWQQRGREDQANKALARLKNAGLVVVEHLLECRNSNTPITSVPDPAALADDAIGGLVHAGCNRAFRDERLSEGYGLSELGRALNQRNHWMTVWMTEQLIEAGVPAESILWNVAEAGEEIDIVLEFFGELWVIELKDREFGPGDAYRFNYRHRVQYAASKGLIVTAEKVDPDAKKALSEFAKEAERASSYEALYGVDAPPRPSRPVIIEGLENVEGVLRKELSSAAMRFATRRLDDLSDATGYELPAAIEKRFRGQTARRFERDAGGGGEVSAARLPTPSAGAGTRN